MKKLIPLLAGALCAGLLTGCMSVSKSLEQLKDDHADVELHIKTASGTLDFTRRNPAGTTNGSGDAALRSRLQQVLDAK